jgi:hypothetical protein
MGPSQSYIQQAKLGQVRRAGIPRAPTSRQPDWNVCLRLQKRGLCLHEICGISVVLEQPGLIWAQVQRMRIVLTVGSYREYKQLVGNSVAVPPPRSSVPVQDYRRMLMVRD